MEWRLSRPCLAAVWLIGSASLLNGGATQVHAQEVSPTPPGDGGRDVEVGFDSGPVRAVQRLDAAGADLDTPRIVLTTEIAAEPGAPWLRLDLTNTVLGGDHTLGRDAFLRITSMRDGAVQILDKVNLNRWRGRSAYFNGDSVLVELFAYPGAAPSRLVVDEVYAAPPRRFTQLTLCGPDDRVLSSDPRSARLLPAGCTAFLIEGSEQCFLTAGHCADSDFKLDVVQFNVPLSNSNGSLNHPPPSDQYPIDLNSVQFTVPGVGNDWGYFGVFPNSNTGQTPLDAQGQAFQIAQAAPPVFGQAIRITGYGLDNTPTAERNQVQQTSTGPYESVNGTTVTYATDTTGGNSGSPVIDETTGVVIGIHTHGGCTSTGGANAGTNIQKASLRNALDNPQGVCAVDFTDCNGNGVPDEDDIAAGTSSDCNVNGVPDECEDLGILGDLDGDNDVDGADLGVLLSQWGSTADVASDLNGDGVVDGADLGLLLSAWGVPC